MPYWPPPQDDPKARMLGDANQRLHKPEGKLGCLLYLMVWVASFCGFWVLGAMLLIAILRS